MKTKKTPSNLTYHDIKKATNLSIGTISRFFNQGSISQKARTKIAAYIEKTNYQPNVGAHLIKGSENCIYVLICSLEDNAIMQIVNSIIEQFQKQQINVYLVVGTYEPKTYLQSLKQTIKRKPKNLILFVPTLDPELRQAINEITIKTIVFGDASTNKTSIIHDNEQYFFNLTQQVLLKQKYQKLVYVGKTAEDLQTGYLRLKGFQKALAKQKIKHEIILVNENHFSYLTKTISTQQLEMFNDPDLLIICGTHTIFEYLWMQKMHHHYRYHLSDIGYLSKLDALANTYDYKIFIDLYYVGYVLYQKIMQQDQETFVIKEKLIDKTF